MSDWQQDNNINNGESHDAHASNDENTNIDSDLDALLADDTDGESVSLEENDNSENVNTEEGNQEQEDSPSDAESSDSESTADSDEKSEEEEEAEFRAALEEEELNDAIDDVADAIDEDEEFLETTDWEWVADLIRFVSKIKKSDDEHIKIISGLFYESDKQLKPLALAEAIEVSLTEGQNERTQMVEFVLRDMVKKSEAHDLTDMAAIRASIMELAQWAYNIPDTDKKHIAQAVTAIAEHFPKKVEKLDQDGNVERDENGNAIMVDVEYVPKRTTKNTTGDEIIIILDELHANIDAERLAAFVSWYDSIMNSLVGEQE